MTSSKKFFLIERTFIWVLLHAGEIPSRHKGPRRSFSCHALAHLCIMARHCRHVVRTGNCTGSTDDLPRCTTNVLFLVVLKNMSLLYYLKPDVYALQTYVNATFAHRFERNETFSHVHKRLISLKSVSL